MRISPSPSASAQLIATLHLVCLAAVSCGTLFSANCLAAEKTDRRPNFLIIFMDDMGYGDLGCYGGTDARTPSIDRLAAEGTRFTSFYAQTVCGPSRGALMTGRYPIRIGGGWTTRADEFTVAEALSGAGYITGCIGKWDMSKRRYQETLVPNSQGFRHYFGPLGANDGGRVRLWRNRQEIEPTSDMASLSKRYTDDSIAFLKQHRDEPFFLYVAHTMMHVVIDASPGFRDRTGKGIYADTLEELDHETGRLLAVLDELGLSDNTLVLLTSDNGPWSNDHQRQRTKNGKHAPWTQGPKTPWGSSGPLRGAKGTTWEGGVRVPGMVRWPGKVPAGRTSPAMISTLDVLPTFAALAGADLPETRPLDGIDQSELLLGKNERGNRDQFFYFDGDELQAVRSGQWKLRLPGLKTLRKWPEVDRGTQQTELYDLEQDLGEQNNVAELYPDLVTELTRLSQTAPKNH